jgi:hypothetical protein
MVTTEDTLDQMVVPRLNAAGADLGRVHFLKAIRQDGQRRTLLLAEDLDLLRTTIKNLGNVGLVTIDPLTAHLGKIDGHSAVEVRSQIGPLADFAEEMNVAVSTITHPAKSASQRAIDHFIGSQAFIAAARIGHVCIREVVKDEETGEIEETGRVLFANAKNNPHRMMPTLAYRIEETVVGQDGTGTNIAAPCVVWDEETVDITADGAVAAATGKPDRGAAVQKFLLQILAGGPVTAQTIEKRGTEEGFSKQQLDRAKKKLGIIAAKVSLKGGWEWRLPGNTQPDLPLGAVDEVI